MEEAQDEHISVASWILARAITVFFLATYSLQHGTGNLFCRDHTSRYLYDVGELICSVLRFAALE